MSIPLDVVIMAAGKGTRMKSALPKVLHRLGGRALLGHVIDCAARVSARQMIVITGHGAIEVEAACAESSWAPASFNMKSRLKFARQEPQLGTGHAVQQALPLLADDGVTLVLSGDVPLTEAATLQALLAVSEPRQPCFKFNDVMGFPQASKLMAQSGYCGAYLGVIVPGQLAAGDEIALIPGPREVNLRELFMARMRKRG